MNMNFLRLFMEKTAFPPEAQADLLRCAEALIEQGHEEALDSSVAFFYDNNFDIKLLTPMMESLAAESGISIYTLWLFTLIEASIPTLAAYEESGISQEIFWATFSDLRYKLLECREIHGVWGNFVAFWYPIFYTCDIVKLGRLEFENCVYEEDTPYEKNGITIKKGDKVKSIHIPSSGEPFTREDRIASYKMAYDFFREERNGGPFICVCHSWLLYPAYKKLLPPTSNIAGFMEDFDIIGQEEEETFGDAWRLFGKDYKKPLSDLPERTSMQRSFKNYLLQGGKPGEGIGVLVFDGEKRIN